MECFMRLPVRTLAALSVVGMLLPVASAQASSDQAWAEFNQRVTRACVAASGIRNARPSTIVGFDDRVGRVAMLVSDRSRGSARAKLCIYDKRARVAYVDDAESWATPPARR
jgi:hypothetical protein